MKKLITIGVILVVSAILGLPLLSPGLHTIHDDQQIVRLFLFDQALFAGQFPVRWVDGLGFGFGYPLFVFYPPLVYATGELFHLFGFGFTDSIKIVFFISIIGSGFAMYLFVKEIFGKYAAMISSIFYMLAPYRAVDIYVRGALAEAFSFVWFPLILLSFYKLATTSKNTYLLLSAVGLALLMLTHNLIFLPFMLILPFYLLFLIWHSSQKSSTILHFSFSILLSFALSAFFWIPALFEKKFTIVDELLLKNLASYSIHFVYPQQLWNWAWGFGGSAAGLADGFSFKIGKIHIISALIALIFATIHLVKNKKAGSVFRYNCYLSILIFGLFIFSAFMTTFYSKFIWDLIPSLGYLQFPWRFLTFTVLFSSISAGSLIYLLKLPILRLATSTILAAFVFVPNFKLFEPQYFRSHLTDELATKKEIINWDISGTSFEYLPKGVELYRGSLGTNLVKIEKSQISQQKIEIIEGEASIDNLKSKPTKISFIINAQKETKFKANIFNFPGWHLTIDNRQVPIDDSNRLKLITASIPPGMHLVEIELKNTRTRNIANSISLFSVLVTLTLMASRLRKLF